MPGLSLDGGVHTHPLERDVWNNQKERKCHIGKFRKMTRNFRLEEENSFLRVMVASEMDVPIRTGVSVDGGFGTTRNI